MDSTHVGILEALVLGVIQGLTEFLPISSSGHLVLVPALFGWKPSGLAFDTVLHLGTLVAVLAYFREDWLRLVRAGIESIANRRIATADERLAWLIIVGSVPAALAGILLGDWFEAMFSRPADVGFQLVVTAGIIVAAEAVGRGQRELAKLRLSDTLLIGVAQAIAIIPGISRSAATISGALFSGLSREASARFSFLLATPAILGAGLVQLPKALGETRVDSSVLPLIVGCIASAVVGYLVISLFLRYLRSRSLYPFAAYCLVLGLVIAFVLGPGWQ